MSHNKLNCEQFTCPGSQLTALGHTLRNCMGPLQIPHHCNLTRWTSSGDDHSPPPWQHPYHFLCTHIIFYVDNHRDSIPKSLREPHPLPKYKCPPWLIPPTFIPLPYQLSPPSPPPPPLELPQKWKYSLSVPPPLYQPLPTTSTIHVSLFCNISDCRWLDLPFGTPRLDSHLSPHQHAGKRHSLHKPYFGI